MSDAGLERTIWWIGDRNPQGMPINRREDFWLQGVHCVDDRRVRKRSRVLSNGFLYERIYWKMLITRLKLWRISSGWIWSRIQPFSTQPSHDSKSQTSSNQIIQSWAFLNWAWMWVQAHRLYSFQGFIFHGLGSSFWNFPSSLSFCWSQVWRYIPPCLSYLFLLAFFCFKLSLFPSNLTYPHKRFQHREHCQESSCGLKTIINIVRTLSLLSTFWVVHFPLASFSFLRLFFKISHRLALIVLIRPVVWIFCWFSGDL